MHFLIKHKKVFFFLLPILPLVILFLIIYKSPVDIVSIAMDGKDVGLAVYDDRINGGNSVAQVDKKDRSIIFTYTLQKGYAFPYSGISFFPKKSPYFDLSGYNQIMIKAIANNGKRIPLAIYTHIENYTEHSDFNTLKNNQVIANIRSNEPQKFQISEFKTPEWWYTLNNKYEKNIPADYSRVKNINISNCLALPLNVQDQIRIEEFRFSVNLMPYIGPVTIFLLLYYTGCIYFFRGRNKPEIKFLYEKTEQSNHRDKEEEAVFSFITSNYYRSEITLAEIQNATGIYEQKISSIIRVKTSLNFKQFLNKLRLSEARRLLRDTDLQISEIAFKVGYGNVSHFNRVFKEAENCSPNEYRKQNNLQ